MAVISKPPYGDSDRTDAAAAGPLGERNYLQGTDINPVLTNADGKGLVNQYRGVRGRIFNRPGKGSVTVTTVGTPKPW